MKKKVIVIIILTVLITTYIFSIPLLLEKVDSSDKADIILQITTTIIGGILSALVAYFIARVEINNYKKEQEEVKIEEIKKQGKLNSEKLKRILLEVEDNQQVIKELNVNKVEFEQQILPLKTSLSDFFWKLNSNEISISQELMVELNIYYRNIYIIQTSQKEDLDFLVIQSFIDRQHKVINSLVIELKELEDSKLQYKKK